MPNDSELHKGGYIPGSLPIETPSFVKPREHPEYFLTAEQWREITRGR